MRVVLVGLVLVIAFGLIAIGIVTAYSFCLPMGIILLVMVIYLLDKKPPPSVEYKAFSSGLSTGWYKNIVLTGVLGSVAIGIMSQSITPAFMIFMLSSSVALIGEAITIYKKGELTATRRKPYQQTLLIKREDHPKHFFFHIAIFAILGTFSLVIGTILLWVALW